MTKKLENPCSLCLVKPACTEVCVKKRRYSNKIINILTEFSAKYVYDSKGCRNFIGINTPTHKHLDKLVDMCEENSNNFQEIYDRKCSW